eukprot:TRINITY_DN8305_c0_g1_i1.p1 TRINITY_DN8305_c0_g1~~TRINITY_DN8305_c0_g1_i1.p1  ORF type:complete len:91 (-),score=3.45 TRINITY_DN8305_c0_g1_i1:161-433(-)
MLLTETEGIRVEKDSNLQNTPLFVRFKDTRDGKSPLIWSALNGMTQCVDLPLRNKEPPCVDTLCHKGMSALDYAIDKGHDAVVDLSKSSI